MQSNLKKIKIKHKTLVLFTIPQNCFDIVLKEIHLLADYVIRALWPVPSTKITFKSFKSYQPGRLCWTTRSGP